MSEQADPLAYDEAKARLRDVVDRICETRLGLELIPLLAELFSVARTLGWLAMGKPRSGLEGIRRYLTAKLGQKVSNGELEAAAAIDDYGRRIRELRDDFGAPILSGSALSDIGRLMLKALGIDHLRPSEYVLLPGPWSIVGKGRLSKQVRAAVLARDGSRCTACNWSAATGSAGDPRHLEVHHRVRPEHGGDHSEANLVTLCNVCHAGNHSRTEGRGKLL